MSVAWKKVCGLICLLLVLLATVLPVGAAEVEKTEDSVTIADDILSCLDTGTVDTIFRVYDMNDGYDSFVRYGDMDGVLANTPTDRLRSYYFVKDKSGETTVYTYDGTSLSEQRYMGGSVWFDIHSQQAGSVIQKIDTGIAVENIYYLWYPTWGAVYYKTNLGDYVYAMSGNKGYLMGLEPFLSMQVELRELGIKYKDWRDMDNRPYHIKLSEIQADLSPYDITSPDFDPHAPLKTNFKPGKFIAIGSFALLVALVVCRYLIRGHRKNRETKSKLANRI